MREMNRLMDRCTRMLLAATALVACTAPAPTTGAPASASLTPQPSTTHLGLAWAPVTPLSGDRGHLSAVTAAGALYAIGGNPQPPQDGSATVERYDKPSNTWLKAPDLPAATDHAEKELAPAYAYDPAADRYERIADLPTPREHLAVVAYRGTACALGGHFGQADQTPIVECYDPVSRRWSALPPLPRRASDFAAVAVGDELWAVGDDVQVFDGRGWSLGPPLRTPRYGVAAASIGRSIYVIGGAARRPAAAGPVERLDLP